MAHGPVASVWSGMARQGSIERTWEIFHTIHVYFVFEWIQNVQYDRFLIYRKGGNTGCTKKTSQCINRSFWEWKVIGLNLISFPGTGQWTALVSCDYVDYCLPVCDYPCNNVESKLKMLAKRKNSVHCHFEYLYYVYLCEKKGGEGEGLSSNAYACQRISPEIMTQCTDKSIQYFYKFLSVCPSVAWLA